MRLLHVRDFKCKPFETEPEPYAILSHRWSGSETKLADIQTGRVSVADSSKVSRFAQYVKSEFSDLEWIWLDSCCINQESSAELNIAINSMFEWYRQAAVCIIYLPDVEHPLDLASVRNSVWFKRGWTLQELVASKVMVFLTAQWQVVGHKGDVTHLHNIQTGPDIENLLAERTTIPSAVLKDFGASHSLSVDQRMNWMMGRETLKEEDMFYAMYGIFGVTPGANYGERGHGARRRLMDAIEREHGGADLAAGYSDIYAWLDPPDPSTNHNNARDRHEPGTCIWLLQHEHYKSWKTGGSKHLLLHGKAGCGKSVLCSAVVQDLQVHCLDRPKTGLAYFYFTFSDDHKQSYDDMVLSLVAQLGKREPARSKLRELCGRKRPSKHELEQILVAAVLNLDEAFIVLDALDESPELSDTRRDLLFRMRKLLSQASKIRLFATSRHLVDILAFAKDVSCEQISIRDCDVSTDIQHYVTSQLSNEPTLRGFQPIVKRMIEQNVSDNADGMFRWAYLLLDQLAKLKKSNKSTIEAALKRFPKDLDSIYARILLGVDEDDQKDVLTLLRWITYAREPLSLRQLVDTLIIDLEGDAVRFSDRCQPKDILRLLGSLVCTIAVGDGNEHIVQYSDEDTDWYTDEDTDEVTNEATGNATDENTVEDDIGGHAAVKIRLAHFTVQEYLESSRILTSDARQFRLEGNTGHYLLQQSCLTYFLHYRSDNDRQINKQDFETFPLLLYAAESWYHHTLLHEHTDVHLQLELLKSDSVLKDWLLVHNPEYYYTRPFEPPFRLSPAPVLYYASYLGLKLVVVSLLLDHTVNVNATGGKYATALQAASFQGHTGVAELLLQHGADTIPEGGWTKSALQGATEYGHTEIVKLLLEHGADVNLEDFEDGTALVAASEEGHTEIVKLLLEHGANATDGDALMAASGNGQIEVVKLLLEHGANDTDSVALIAALDHNHIEAVALLLERSDALRRDRLGRSLLHISAAANFCDGIDLAMWHGLDINEFDNRQWTALHWGAYFGSVRAIQLLLEHNADSSVCDWQDRTAYEVAILAGSEIAGRVIHLLSPQREVPYKALAFGPPDRGCCMYCNHNLVGFHHHCTACPYYDLCFRCYADVKSIHPEHAFVDNFRYQHIWSSEQ